MKNENEINIKDNTFNATQDLLVHRSDLEGVDDLNQTKAHEAKSIQFLFDNEQTKKKDENNPPQRPKNDKRWISTMNKDNVVQEKNLLKKIKSMYYSKSKNKVNFTQNFEEEENNNSTFYNKKDENLKKFKDQDAKRRSSMLMINQKRKSKRSANLSANIITKMVNKSEDGSEYAILRHKMKKLDILIAIFVSLNIFLCILDNNFYIDETNSYLIDFMTNNNLTSTTPQVLDQMGNRTISSAENGIRLINMILVVGIEIILYLRYKNKIRILQCEKNLSIYDNLFSSGLSKYYLLEAIILIICYPPYLNFVITGNMLNMYFAYSLNSLIGAFVLLKIYIFLHVYGYFSVWTSDFSMSVRKRFGIAKGIYFPIRAELVKNPFISLFLIMLFLLFTMGYMMRTFEYGVASSGYTFSKTGQTTTLSTFDNCLWLILITMTTVGYGDYYPKSHLGRLVGVMSCVTGLLILSLIVVSFANALNFSTGEKKAFSIIKKLTADENAYNKGVEVIKNCIILRKIMKEGKKGQGGSFLTNIFIVITKLKAKIRDFKNEFKIANSQSIPFDEVLKIIQNYLKESTSNLSQIGNKIENVNDELEEMVEDHIEIGHEINEIMFMQEEISEYIVELNNKSYLEKIQSLERDNKEIKNCNFAGTFH